VGIFPDGASSYGCLDLSGNVWEWCATKWVDGYEAYGDKEDNSPEGDARRVVRGSAFDYYRGVVRCACRNRLYPDLVYRYLGFRPVVAPVDSGL
jgi:iron(II)-dependent oxidoreductase